MTGNAEVRGTHTPPCSLPALDFLLAKPAGNQRAKEAVGAILAQSKGTRKQEGYGESI